MGLRERAYRWKEGEDRLVHHSDAGSQYQCHLVKPVCADERVSWSPVDVLRSEFGPQEGSCFEDLLRAVKYFSIR
jgi:hypothetical protein